MWKPKLKLTELGKTLHERGIQILPTRAYGVANGFDLYPAIEEDQVLSIGETRTFETGVRIWLGFDALLGEDIFWAGLLMPRSSNPPGILLQNTIGLLDYDYQGPLKVKLQNLGDYPRTIKKNEAFAQLLIVPSYVGEFELHDEEEWPITNRASNGFGSSNK